MNLKFEYLVLPELKKQRSNFILMELEAKVQEERKLKFIEEKEIEMAHFINSLNPACHTYYDNITNINNDIINTVSLYPPIRKLTPIKKEEEYETTYEDEEALDYQSPPNDEDEEALDHQSPPDDEDEEALDHQSPPDDEEYVLDESEKEMGVNDYKFLNTVLRL